MYFEGCLLPVGLGPAHPSVDDGRNLYSLMQPEFENSLNACNLKPPSFNK